ncbi:sensor histidine kinase [Nonomuraea insulae]|uniref:sensor histidine kinase n=1 Tax=Nonomuraea insulae TaxID=1616787 RepID=UPI0036D3AE8F
MTLYSLVRGLVPRWREPVWTSRRSKAWLVAAAVVVGWGQVPRWLSTAEPRLGGGLAVWLLVAMLAAIVVAVYAPLSAAVVALTAAVLIVRLTADSGWGELPWPPTVLITLCWVLLLVTLRRSFLTSLTLWLAAVLLGLVANLATTGHIVGGDQLSMIAVTALIWVVGVLTRDRQQAHGDLLEHERATAVVRAERVLLEERARIARELHDVVAHHMSVITTRADSATYRLTGLPDAAAAEFTQVADEARQALTEMRSLLRALRGSTGRPEYEPQPDLSRLDELIAAHRAAGSDVELAVDLPPGAMSDALPADRQLIAYRVIQEALANAARHAPGAAIQVDLTRETDGLRVSVVNRPAPEARPATGREPAGHGLVGMRERLNLTDGTLRAGPTLDGGYQVSAWIPLPAVTKETNHDDPGDHRR